MKSSVDYMNKTTRGDPRGELLAEEGGERECLPTQLCADLTLLIMEGRKPDWSVKGRTEGEHCPPSRGAPMHQCHSDKQSCSQIASVNAYINFLCRNDIPVSVEVLLYPDCCYGNQKRIEVGAAAEGGKDQVYGLQEYVVLEQWIIQVLPKKFHDGYGHFHVLMQAVRSFLHFSQLSAWLSSSHGRAPANIVYRVCAHGESFAENTQVQPEVHSFPFLNISKSSSLQVTVASLPRQQGIPMPACYNLLHNTGSIGKAKVTTKPTTKPNFGSDLEHVAGHKRRREEDPDRQTYRYSVSGNPDQNRIVEHAFSMHERGLPYERHRTVRDSHSHQRDATEEMGGNWRLKDVLERETRRGSLEHEWNLEAIQQRKAQVRNSSKLRDSPKLLRNSPGSYKAEYEGDSEKIPRLNLDDKGGSFENLFKPISSLLTSEQMWTPARTQEDVCQNVSEIGDMRYPEKLVALEEGLSSLKLHHIPATPCTAFCTPETESLGSRSTSLGSTDSDQGITFTARPLSDEQCADWEEDDAVQSDYDQNDANQSESFADDSFPFDPFDYRDLLGAAEQSHNQRPSQDSVECLTLVEDSHNFGSSNSIISQDECACVTSSDRSLDKCSRTFGSSNSIISQDNCECLDSSDNCLDKNGHTFGSSNSLISLDSCECVTSSDRCLDKCSHKYGSTNSLSQNFGNGLHNSSRTFGSSDSIISQDSCDFDQCLEKGSHTCSGGSTNSLVNLTHEVCHQPNADLCFIPSVGARVTAEECAARRRHVSGNSQDGLDTISKTASCEALTNQSAITSDGETPSQCFNAAVFKSKALQEANNARSSPTASPNMSPRRSSLPRGCGGPLWDDFKPDISAPFSSVVKPQVVSGGEEEKENSADSAFPFLPGGKGKSLLRNVLSKACQVEETSTEIGRNVPRETITKASMRRSLDRSASYVFNPRTGLPINSSPAPLRKTKTTTDCPSLLKPIGLTSSPSCNNLEQTNYHPLGQHMRTLSTSAPATSCLLGNFEESVLNGRLEPLGTIDGFHAEIGASGAFCPKHICLPVTTFFYSVCDDDAPSSYFGHINLEVLGRRGYQIPKCGTIQVTLFNPNKTVVKMFVVRYDLSDMPPNCQTFARQRIFYMPSDDVNDDCDKELRYLVHLRFQTSKSGKVYLHTDIRMIFARHSPDLESSFGTFELRSFTEVPTNPRFSPKK